jgi:hypothetical protein
LETYRIIMGKAKNESEFTTVRVKKTTLKKLLDLNLRDIQVYNKRLTLYETIDLAANKLLSKSIKTKVGKKIVHNIENSLQKT